MSTYAWVDLLSVLVPFVFSFHPRLRFHRQWHALWPAVAVMMAVFIPWDALFTAKGIWGFNAEHVWPTRLLGLPLEEWLFFICIPYCCLFCHHCFQVLGMKDVLGPAVRWISMALVAVLVAVVITHLDRSYTAVACSLCAIWIVCTAFIQRAPWLGRFFFTYLIILLPFCVVNGVLTGTGLETPVVWYNDAENLGVRMGTIPVEDVFYGMFMVGLTTSVYEWCCTRSTKFDPLSIR